ncbi:unannotated protein [freshwater metagenome]|uniref:Unannotated protein n=1 Tax=freshwater metagenome TaxID=449393 RepID=A0A6J7RJ98_9ZZZZ|nr:DUF4233 domain-containing protein [Actinomycetota bacterium]MSW11542.1 DUF4233 domain-containing protein [Actinomycetota bacterium]
MKVLCSAVLAIEALIVLLAIPVAATNGSVANPGWAIGIGMGLAVLLVLAIGTLRRSWGVGFGWIMQVAVLALGLLVPLMFIVGAIFAILWFFAVRNGRRVDALRAERDAGPDEVAG